MVKKIDETASLEAAKTFRYALALAMLKCIAEPSVPLRYIAQLSSGTMDDTAWSCCQALVCQAITTPGPIDSPEILDRVFPYLVPEKSTQGHDAVFAGLLRAYMLTCRVDYASAANELAAIKDAPCIDGCITGPHLHTALLTLYERAGDIAAIERLLEDHRPESAIALVNLLVRVRDLSRADLVLRRALEQFPAHPGLMVCAARFCQSHWADFPGAYRYMKRAAELQPSIGEASDVSLALALGDLYSSRSDAAGVQPRKKGIVPERFAACMAAHWPPLQLLPEEARLWWEHAVYSLMTAEAYTAQVDKLVCTCLSNSMEAALEGLVLDHFREHVLAERSAWICLNDEDSHSATILLNVVRRVRTLSVGEYAAILKASKQSAAAATLKDWIAEHRPALLNYDIAGLYRVADLRKPGAHSTRRAGQPFTTLMLAIEFMNLLTRDEPQAAVTFGASAPR